MLVTIGGAKRNRRGGYAKTSALQELNKTGPLKVNPSLYYF